MKELIGIRWGDLAEETRNQLFEMATIWDDVEDGECIYDLTDCLAVRGTVKCINKAESDYEFTVDDDAIIYCPEDGVLDIYKDDKGFAINEIMTVNEAAELYNITEGAIRAAIKSNKFIIGVDYRKAGRITLITKDAMNKVYGEKKL